MSRHILTCLFLLLNFLTQTVHLHKLTKGKSTKFLHFFHVQKRIFICDVYVCLSLFLIIFILRSTQQIEPDEALGWSETLQNKRFISF